MTKKIYASKTFWVNAVTILAGIVGYVAGSEIIADNTALVAGLIAVQGVVNVVLRFLTWAPVEL